MGKSCDALIQRSWLRALQSLSDVHLPTSHIKAGKLANLTQAERHQIKDALTSFNEEIAKTLTDSGAHVNDRVLRASLAAAAVAFVVPVYQDFLDKFGELPFSAKNKDKYVIYWPKALSDAISKHFLGHA